MTQNIDRITVPEQWSEPSDRPVPPPAATGPQRSPRWRRHYIIPIAVLTIAFLAYQVPPYFSLDPSRSRVPIQFPAHYVFLAGHVITGTVALITMSLQMWPWLRRRHPAVHRISGRIYMLGGALPAAVFALLMFPVAFQAGSIAVIMSSVLWSATAIVGWVRARQRRWEEHQRWMIYSFAIVWGQVVWGFIMGMIMFKLPFGIDVNYISETARWVGWTGNLILAHWLLERRAGRNLGGAQLRPAAAIR